MKSEELRERQAVLLKLSETSFFSTGFGSFASAVRLVAVVAPDAAPVRRLIQEARDRGALIDATAGRKTRSVLLMDSDHVLLSALSPELLMKNMSDLPEAAAEVKV